MINSIPSARPQPQPQPLGHAANFIERESQIFRLDPVPFGHDRDPPREAHKPVGPPKSLEDAYPAATTAAVALAELHNHRPELNWDSEAVSRILVSCRAKRV